MVKKIGQLSPTKQADNSDKSHDSALPGGVSPRHSGELQHQLHVHQIELEMQNEALRQAQINLELSRDSYVELYELAPVGYMTLTPRGQVSKINLTMTKLLGIERQSLLQKRFASFVIPEDQDKWHRYFVMAKENSVMPNTEFTLKRGDGRLLHVLVNCASSNIDAGNLDTNHHNKLRQLLLSLTDVTELIDSHNQSYSALRNSKAFLSTIINNAPGLIGYWTSDLHCGFANAEYRTWFGRSTEEMDGMSLSTLLGKDLFHLSEPDIRAVLNGKNCMFERELMKPDGSLGNLLVHYVAHIVSGKVEGFFVFATDVTQLKQIKEALSEATISVDLQDRVIGHLKDKNQDLNTTLDTLLSRKQEILANEKAHLSEWIEQLVMPFLVWLQKDLLKLDQIEAINVIEANLQELISSYGRVSIFTALTESLTPKEIQIASMVKRGLSSKEIAKILTLSINTVNNHRKNIRRKLKFESKAINLRSHLRSMQE